MSSTGPRSIRSPADLDGVRFHPRDGLVPVVAQDAATGHVLMLAYADRTALQRTLETGEMHYHSRSRSKLWHKGATSGNVQRVRELLADCDGDAILALVDPAGPACHTGRPTCFGAGRDPTGGTGLRPTGGRPAAAELATPQAAVQGTVAGEGAGAAARHGGSVLGELWRVIEERAAARPAGSYTTRLLHDPNLRIKKLGEEMAEFIAALSAGDAGPVRAEAADLLYHLFVALRGAGIALVDLEAELAARRAVPSGFSPPLDASRPRA